MAINLNPGADQELVKAATDAAMAGVPKDNSRVQERMMRAHGNMMRSVGETFVQGIKGATKIGEKLIQQAREKKAVTDNFDAFNEPIEPRILEEGETLSFKDNKLERLKMNLEVDPTNEKKINKYEKRLLTLKNRDWSTRVYTDVNGNEEIVQPITIGGQVKNIRKEILNLRLNKVELSEEELEAGLTKKDKIAQLKTKKDNLKSSIVEFGSTLKVMKEQLDLDNVDIIASSQGIDGQKKLLFARALLADGKPLGEDAGEYEGARAQVGFTADKGNMAFMFVDETGRPIIGEDGNQLMMMKGDASSLLVTKNPKIQTGMDLVTDKKVNRLTGEKYGEAFDPNKVNSFVDNNVLDINSFKNASHYKGENMDASLASSLHGVAGDGGKQVIAPTILSASIFGELNNLPMSLDVSGDGKVNELDFKSSDNYSKLVDYILSGKDLDLSKKVLKEKLRNDAANHHQLGVNDHKAKDKQRNLNQNLNQNTSNKANIQKINNAIMSGDFSGLNTDKKRIIKVGDSYKLIKQGMPSVFLPINDSKTDQEIMNFWRGKSGVDYKEPFMFNQEGEYSATAGLEKIINEGLPEEITNPKDGDGGDAKNPFPPDSHTSITTTSGVPIAKTAEEGKYYLGHNGITYLFDGVSYKPITKKGNKPKPANPTYKIQLGTFEEALSDAVFNGIKNVGTVKGKDGGIIHTAGSFTTKKEADDYLNQMRARGFEDAAIVTDKPKPE